MKRVLLYLCCTLLLCACRPPAPDAASSQTPEQGTAANQTDTGAKKTSEIQALHTKTPLFSPPVAVVNEAASITPANMGLSSWMELAPTLACSLEYAEQWEPSSRAVEHSGRLITWGEVAASLRRLQELLPGLDTDPSPLVREFQWIGITPDVRFTGYFTPILNASPVRTPEYNAPIYRLPEELATDLAWCLPSHTCPDSAFTSTIIRPKKPFHSRATIDLDNVLGGRNLEMAWLEHPFDTYELMLEGSGMLQFPDGTRRMAHFAGLNGNPGQSLLGYLIRTGQLPRAKATMGNAKHWWDANPKKRRALLEAASSYVFFRYSSHNAATGTTGCELVPWVSMAVDPTVLPLGGIVAYSLPGQPIAGGIRNGLGFAQDTGGAIRMRRIDMFTGQGPQGYAQAMNISTKGQVWLLLLRENS